MDAVVRRLSDRCHLDDLVGRVGLDPEDHQRRVPRILGGKDVALAADVGEGPGVQPAAHRLGVDQDRVSRVGERVDVEPAGCAAALRGEQEESAVRAHFIVADRPDVREREGVDGDRAPSRNVPHHQPIAEPEPSPGPRIGVVPVDPEVARLVVRDVVPTGKHRHRLLRGGVEDGCIGNSDHGRPQELAAGLRAEGPADRRASFSVSDRRIGRRGTRPRTDSPPHLDTSLRRASGVHHANAKRRWQRGARGSTLILPAQNPDAPHGVRLGHAITDRRFCWRSPIVPAAGPTDHHRRERRHVPSILH